MSTDVRPRPDRLAAGDVASWALPLLRCPSCAANGLEPAEEGLSCDRCGARWPVIEGVAHLLATPREEVAREQAAVARLDRESAAEPDPRPARLRRLFDGECTREEIAGDPYLEHAWEVRVRTLEVLQKAPLRPGETLLELGADHGWGSGLLLDAGARVLALDINDHLHRAPRRGDAHLCCLQADMNRLPLADSSLDVVWATAAAHHSWDLTITFREAHRVLRPGGRLCFLCEPMPSWLRYLAQRDVGAEERALGIHESWIRRGRWLKLCRRAGLTPRLVLPGLSTEEIRQRLRGHNLPAALAPLVRPLLPTLQVSIHLLATKPE